jgi:hypothetical protein
MLNQEYLHRISKKDTKENKQSFYNDPLKPNVKGGINRSDLSYCNYVLYSDVFKDLINSPNGIN